jgi:hypothetical protein
MTFQIKLQVHGELPAVLRTPGLEVELGQALSRYDELVHVLTAQCRAVAATGRVSFHVEGFGQVPWPVDVENDLAVVLEQLPTVVSKLRGGDQVFFLNFYEQGIERYLTGTKYGEKVTLECMSLSLQWSPEPSLEMLQLAEVDRMLIELFDVYIATVERVCPWLSEAPVFVRWMQEVRSR